VSGVCIECPDDNCAVSDCVCSAKASLKGILDQGAANALASAIPVDRKLADEKASEGVWRPSGSDCSRGTVGLDDAWSKPAVADDASVIVNDQNAREISTLAGSGEPDKRGIEGRLSAAFAGGWWQGLRSPR